ncbi:MAG TPA: LysR family transcriptional regulator [Ideonella sp.]|jgi:DNA-binding transcriptional LysR family regulator|nr:LysR family transcriptional regulator [Ideonella sp.]
MDLAFDDLKLFARGAALGTLSAAARERDVPVSQVSRALARIEAACGARLIHRSTHGLALTDEGRTFLDYCQRLTGTMEALQGEFAAQAREPSGLVRVAASTVVAQYLLLPSLASLNEKHPALRVELEVSDRLADMARDGIDIAIRTGTVLPETMIARHIGTLGRSLYAAPGYAERHGLPVHPSELPRHRLITNTAAPNLNHWPFVIDGEPATLVAEGFWRTNDTGLAANMVLQGLGIGRLGTVAARPLLRARQLVPVLAGFVDPQPVPIYAVIASTRQRLPKIRACVDHWAAWMGDEEAGEAPTLKPS